MAVASISSLNELQNFKTLDVTCDINANMDGKLNLDDCSPGDYSIPELVNICEDVNPPGVKVPSHDFDLLEKLGKGGYGQVYLAKKVNGAMSGECFAMKVVKKARLITNKKDDKKYAMTERNILEAVNHPFLVKLYFAFQTNHDLFMVLEYLAGGEHFMQLGRQHTLTEDESRFYLAEITLALGHLHSTGISYRDLKSENVMLDSFGHVKLTDFGLSKERNDDELIHSFCGTVEYMAPEVLQRRGHGPSVDWGSQGTEFFGFINLITLPPRRSRQNGSRAWLLCPEQPRPADQLLSFGIAVVVTNIIFPCYLYYDIIIIIIYQIITIIYYPFIIIYIKYKYNLIIMTAAMFDLELAGRVWRVLSHSLDEKFLTKLSLYLWLPYGATVSVLPMVRCLWLPYGATVLFASYLWPQYRATGSFSICAPGVAPSITPWQWSSVETWLLLIVIWRLRYGAAGSYDSRAFGDTLAESPSQLSGPRSEELSSKVLPKDEEPGRVPIYVRLWDGGVRAVQAHLTDRVRALYQSLQDVLGVPAGMLLLTFGGLILDSSQTLEEAGVLRGAALSASIRLRGGAGSMGTADKRGAGAPESSELQDMSSQHCFLAKIKAKDNARHELDALVKALSSPVIDDDEFFKLRPTFSDQFSVVADQLTVLADLAERFDEHVSAGFLEELEEVDQLGLTVEDLATVRLRSRLGTVAKAKPVGFRPTFTVVKQSKVVLPPKVEKIPTRELEEHACINRRKPADQDTIQKSELKMGNNDAVAEKVDDRNQCVEVINVELCADLVATESDQPNDSLCLAMSDVRIASEAAAGVDVRRPTEVIAGEARCWSPVAFLRKQGFVSQDKVMPEEGMFSKAVVDKIVTTKSQCTTRNLAVEDDRDFSIPSLAGFEKAIVPLAIEGDGRANKEFSAPEGNVPTAACARNMADWSFQETVKRNAVVSDLDCLSMDQARMRSALEGSSRSFEFESVVDRGHRLRTIQIVDSEARTRTDWEIGSWPSTELAESYNGPGGQMFIEIDAHFNGPGRHGLLTVAPAPRQQSVMRF